MVKERQKYIIVFIIAVRMVYLKFKNQKKILFLKSSSIESGRDANLTEQDQASRVDVE